MRTAAMAVTVGRPTTSAHDTPVDLTLAPTGYVAPLALEAGTWLMLIEAEAADGTLFSQRHPLYVRSRP